MEKVDLLVDDLLLDLENPRLGSAETQAEALQAIVDLDHKHFRTMMESIRDHGLDPGDAFYVILTDEETDYIVVDGNRRLAALKVLRGPELLQAIEISDHLRKRLQDLAESFDKSTIDSVECVQFEDRSSANEWILRRHGRGLDGEERIHWGTLEIQRFQNDRTILDILDFVERNRSFSDDRWELIKERVEKKTSVLRRFLESKPIRQLLGLTIVDDGEQKIPEFKITPSQARAAMEQILSDIADGDIDTRTHNRTDDIATYASDLKETKDIDDKQGASQRFRDITIGPKNRQKSSAPEKSKSTSKKSKVRPPRVYLGPKKLDFAQPPSEKGRRLFYEASKIRLADTPLAAAYLLRAVLEHTLQVYMTRHNMPDYDSKKQRAYDLKQRAQQVIDHLVTSDVATKQQLRGVARVLTVSTHTASIQALNDYHHDKFLIPSGDDLRAAWDASEALFAAVYGPAK